MAARSATPSGPRHLTRSNAVRGIDPTRCITGIVIFWCMPLVFATLLEGCVPGCGPSAGAVELEFDTECVNVNEIADVFADEVAVTSGLQNPPLCGAVSLGTRGSPSAGGDIDVVPDEPERLSAIGDEAVRYMMQGFQDGMDEAFFTTLPWGSYSIEDPLALPLLSVTPMGSLWTYAAPGIRLPGFGLWNQVTLQNGDEVDGFDPAVEFQLRSDPRIRVVTVAFWRLVHDSDGEGALADERAVRSWFGEQAARRLGSATIAGDPRLGLDEFLQVEIEEYPDPMQSVDSLFAQCDVGERLQFHLVHYEEAPLPERIVDGLDVREDGSCGGLQFNMDRVLGNVGGGPRFADDAVDVNIYFVESFGFDGLDWCEGTPGIGTQAATLSGPSVILVAENIRFWLSGDEPGRFILAHELVHAMRIVNGAANGGGHCDDAGVDTCIEDDLMQNSVGGTRISPDDCASIFGG